MSCVPITPEMSYILEAGRRYGSIAPHYARQTAEFPAFIVTPKVCSPMGDGCMTTSVGAETLDERTKLEIARNSAGVRWSTPAGWVSGCGSWSISLKTGDGSEESGELTGPERVTLDSRSGRESLSRENDIIPLGLTPLASP